MNEPGGYRIRGYKEFLVVVNNIRIDSDMTQKEVAMRAAVSQSSISGWLNGKNHPLAQHMLAVVEALGYDVVLTRRAR